MNSLIFGLGPAEITLVCFLVVILFGGKKIPELMRGVGRGLKEFSSARKAIEKEIEETREELK